MIRSIAKRLHLSTASWIRYWSVYRCSVLFYYTFCDISKLVVNWDVKAVTGGGAPRHWGSYFRKYYLSAAPVPLHDLSQFKKASGKPVLYSVKRTFARESLVLAIYTVK